MVLRAFKLYKNSVSGLSREVWLLALVTFINRCGTMVIPFLSVYMKTQLGFSLGEVGLILLFFGLGSVSGSYIGGVLTDKLGYYKTLFLSLFFGGLMFLILGVVESFWSVCAVIFLAATIGDAYRPAAMTAMAIYSHPANRTRAFSLMRMAINFGWAMGPAIGGWLAVISGYYALFCTDALTCIAASFVFLYFLKPRQKKDEGMEVTEDSPEPFRSPYSDRIYLAFLFFTVIGALVFMQFLYTLPIFYKEKMFFTEGEIGLLLAMNGLLIALTEMPIVYTLERRIGTLDNVAIGVLMFGAAYVILNFATGPSIFIAVLSMVTLSIGEIFNMPFTNTYAMSRATEGNRGAYMGLFSMVYSAAHILGPPIGTQVAAMFGFNVLWYLMGTLCLISFIGIRVIKQKTKKEEENLMVIPARSPQTS